jgi:flavin-dependent dehydrogenase
VVRDRSRITVIGGGPAGCAAALAAMSEGSAVTLYEKSRFPRHKVCGEFLSPELVPALESLAVSCLSGCFSKPQQVGVSLRRGT